MGKITLSCELCGETVTHYETFFHEVGGIQFKINNKKHHICDDCCELLGSVIIKIMKGYKYKGKWKEKEVDDPTCLYLKQVEQLVGSNNMVEFNKWMRGQGCPVMSDNTMGFFKWDVEQFIEEELTWHTLDGRAIKINDLEDEHLLNIKTHLEERIKQLNNTRIYVNSLIKSSKIWLEKIIIEINKRQKTILVTGGCGFIGTNLLEYIEQHYPLLKIVNVDCMTYAAKPYNTKNKNYVFKKTNICNFKQLEKIFKEQKPDYVMHLAAQSHVDNSIKNDDPFIQTNIIGTHNLLKLCKQYNTDKHKVRFHYVNTDEVYGQLGLKDKPFDNSTKWNPRSPYSASKASGAHLTMSYHQTFGLPVTISQCSNNYGPHQHKEKFIPTVILSKIVPVYGTGKNVRDWIYVEDHCRALMNILLHGEIGKSYNIGGECELTNLQVIKTIDKKKQIKFVEDRKGHDFRYAIKTDFKPQISFKEGIKKTIEWYKGSVLK